jgi:hypothetical protein
MKLVVEHRLSCVKLSPTLPGRIAHDTLADYARGILQRLMPASEVRDITSLLQGTHAVTAVYPPKEQTVAQQHNLKYNMIGLHQTVNWITADPLGHDLHRENWGSFTDEEVKARYTAILNDEVDRLRTLYEAL